MVHNQLVLTAVLIFIWACPGGLQPLSLGIRPLSK